VTIAIPEMSLRERVVVAVMVLALIGCANTARPLASGTLAPTVAVVPSAGNTTKASAVDGRFRGVVSIGDGKSVHLVCAGSGSPTVIMVHGLGSSTADWTSVLNRIDDTTHACSVDRIGAGLSTPATEDRTTSAIVDDLHALLGAAGIKTPIVLAGHSIAGLDLRLHAGRYPDDLAGMVFVDPSAVGQFAAQLDALGPASPTEPAAIREYRDAMESGWPEPELTVERYDIEASEADVAAVASFGDIPVVVLTAGLVDETLPEPSRTRTQAAWYQGHVDLAAMSTNGRNEVVEGAGHAIQLDRPDAVVEAIEELVQLAR
jgi:pimeloyl-ACP methyl ester carboxylesterase